jgi:hypothetical protein
MSRKRYSIPINEILGLNEPEPGPAKPVRKIRRRRDWMGLDPAVPSYDRLFVPKTERDRWLERIEKYREKQSNRRWSLKRRLQSRLRKGLIAPITEAELGAITYAMFPDPQDQNPDLSKFPH